MRESRGLMGLPAPALGYDGMVIAGQQRVQVQDGVMQINGKRFSVSEDGKVLDENDKQVAQIQNGRLMPLQQQAQPQGAA